MPLSAQTLTAAGKNWVRAVLVVAGTSCLAAPVLADAAAVLPPGPAETLGAWEGDISALAALLGTGLSVEEWRAALGGEADDPALAALADYLGINAPIEGVAGSDVQAVLAVLPSDGKALFLNNCLSCHGGDKYFLQQTKSADEWLGIFDAPYHRRLLTDGVERETFASYAAYATPIVLETIPEVLQDAAQ